jgi:hypothetical protein
MAADHFAAGALIVDRLKASVTGMQMITACATIGQAQSFRQFVPSLLVIPDIENVLPGSPNHPGQMSEQNWLVVVRVRNVAEALDGVAALKEAGEHVAAVLAALQGWEPAGAYEPLKRITAPRLAYETGDMAIIIAFALPLQTDGAKI